MSLLYQCALRHSNATFSDPDLYWPKHGSLSRFRRKIRILIFTAISHFSLKSAFSPMFRSVLSQTWKWPNDTYSLKYRSIRVVIWGMIWGLSPEEWYEGCQLSYDTRVVSRGMIWGLSAEEWYQSVSALQASLCAEMASELKFALKCHGSTRPVHKKPLRSVATSDSEQNFMAIGAYQPYAFQAQSWFLLARRIQ